MHCTYDEIGQIILPGVLSIIRLDLNFFHILNHSKISAASYETYLYIAMDACIYIYLHTHRVHFEMKGAV